MQRDATRRDAISPGRNLLKSYGFKFKRAVTYFTRYNMISRGNHVDLSQHCRRFLCLEFEPRRRRALPQPILIRSQESQDGINGKLLAGAGPRRVLPLPLPLPSPSNYSNVTTLLPSSIYRCLEIRRYLRTLYLSLSSYEEGRILQPDSQRLSYLRLHRGIASSERIFFDTIKYNNILSVIVIIINYYCCLLRIRAFLAVISIRQFYILSYKF